MTSIRDHAAVRSQRLRRLVPALLAAAWAATAAPAGAATFTVDDDGDGVDAVPGDGTCATAVTTCTLRAAVQEANALPGADRIEFVNVIPDDPPRNYSQVTLALAGRGEDAAATGDLDVTDDLVVDGVRLFTIGSNTLRVGTGVDAAGLDRVFHVLPGVTVELDGVSVINGATGPGENGGGILNEGTLIATNALVAAGNTADGDGGGLYNAGEATVYPRFRGNAAAGRGGGIANVGTLTLVHDPYTASLAGNHAAAGGAIYNAGALTGKKFSIMQNDATAGAGGGLLNDAGATAYLADVTLGANTSTAGASGLDNHGAVDLRHCTLNAHAAPGLANDDAGGATTTVASTALGDDCAGTVTSGGYNVTASCALAGAAAGDQIGVDPRLESQASCAALYVTDFCPFYRPRVGSPLIDAGDPAGCIDYLGAPLVTDQRIVLQPTGPACDVGAIEVSPPCIGGAPFQKAKLTLSGIDRGPGKQKVKFSGRMVLPFTPALPQSFGAQIAVEDLGGATMLVNRSDAGLSALPAGGLIPFSCSEWRPHGPAVTYRELIPPGGCAHPPPADQRVKTVKVIDRRTKPSHDVQIDFEVTNLTVAAPTLPLRTTFTFGGAARFSQGHCGAQVFSPTACVRRGSNLACKNYF